MQDSLTLTLASWTDYIWVVLVGATMVGSWIGNAKKKQQEQRKRDEGPAAVELEEMASRRREQLRQASNQRAQAQNQPRAAGGEPGNMTMAERIARARAKAQYEQRAQSKGRPAQVSQPQVPNEAQRRVLAQRQAELERRRQAAQAQQQAQQQAKQQQAQRRAQQHARQQQARAHAQAQTQARRSGRLVHEPSPVPEPTTSTTRRLVPERSSRRVTRKPEPVLIPADSSPIPHGPLSRADLRRAIILKEVLDKPLALRDTQGYSL